MPRTDYLLNSYSISNACFTVHRFFAVRQQGLFLTADPFSRILLKGIRMSLLFRAIRQIQTDRGARLKGIRILLLFRARLRK